MNGISIIQIIAFKMAEFLEHIRTHFSIIQKDDYLSLTLINPNISSDIMNEIRNQFRQHLGIRKQEVVILETVNFDDDLLVILAQSLPLSLTQLSLDFTGCVSLKGPGFVDLFQRISQMENLTKLHLDFCEIHDINDYVVEGMSLLFESLPELTDFYLDLYEVDQISQDGYLMLAESISCMTKLQKIHIDLSANQHLTEDALQLLFSGLPPCLKQLGFRVFDIEHIGGGSFFKLAESISKMKKLETIKLAISTLENLNPKGIYAIIKSVGSAINIKTLDLNLSNINLPEKMLSYIVLPQCLEHLSLDVSCNRNLSDRDIVCFIMKIPTVNRLKSASFNFDFCNRISQESIQLLLSKLCENKSLMKLCLPERKYSHAFMGICTEIIWKSNCKNSMALLYFTVEEWRKPKELKKAQIYRDEQRSKRNITFGSELMRINKHLANHQKEILRLFLP